MYSMLIMAFEIWMSIILVGIPVMAAMLYMDTPTDIASMIFLVCTLSGALIIRSKVSIEIRNRKPNRDGA
jgi:hypothetical protein